MRKSMACRQSEGAGRTRATATRARRIAAKRTGSRFMKFLREENAFFIVMNRIAQNQKLGQKASRC